MKDRDDYWWGLLGGDVRSVHDLAMCITEDMVPDDPYDAISRHAQRSLLLPERNVSAGFLEIEWWR